MRQAGIQASNSMKPLTGLWSWPWGHSLWAFVQTAAEILIAFNAGLKDFLFFIFLSLALLDYLFLKKLNTRRPLSPL